MKALEMQRPLIVAFALSICASACGSLAPAPIAGSATNVRAVCAGAPAGAFSCLALIRNDVGGAVSTGYHGEDLTQAFPAAPHCNKTPPYCASDLQDAYGITQASAVGTGIVAIVDAFGYPNAEADLAVYRSAMLLPACTIGSGCLRIVNESGASSPLPSPNPFWGAEQAIDMDMVSAICPNCKIILVQATAADNPSFSAAENAAVSLGADAVSNSYDAAEKSADNPAFNHPGHVITASAGDGGAGMTQPCSFTNVVCVGGTSLTPSSGARGWSEVTWGTGLEDGTGSGCSTMVQKPVWQTDKGCTMRSETDISAVADPNTGVAIYYPLSGGWVESGGTSVASPIIAAMFALAGNSATISAPQFIWAHGGTNAYHDIISGSNPGVFRCPAIMLYICQAGPGYDGPTGWGTPNGISGF